MPVVKLLIRSADQSIPDLTVDKIDDDWTVKQLKIHLQTAHSAKPAAERQRLIFAGQLLKDDVCLIDYFRNYQSGSEDSATSPCVVHLICAPDIECSLAAVGGHQLDQTTNELRHRRNLPTREAVYNVPSSSISSSNVPLQVLPGQPTNIGGWSPLQYQPNNMTVPTVGAVDWFQQQQWCMANALAASQWYSQYIQTLYGLSANGSPTSPTFFMPQNFNVPIATAEGVDAPVPPEQPIAGQPPAGPMNVEGGMADADMDEDDPRNRDWLDYVYLGCRAGLLLMILYFYSSIERFLFVVGCYMLLYGFQAGWFGRRVEIREIQRPERPRNPQPPDEPEANGGPDEQREAAAPGAPVRTEDRPPVTAWNVFWMTCWTFISSFFSSLFPERPPPLNM